jgi:putative transposase
VYPVLFIDAMFVKVRDGQVANRPIYVAIGVTVDGERDILGLWAGRGGEGAKCWLQVLTEIKNRGVEDVCIVVCDVGLPDAIEATWRQAVTQTCVLHLLRNSFRYASKKYWPAIALGADHRVRRRVGGPLPRDRAAVRVSVVGVHSLLGVPYGDPHRSLQHAIDQRDRVPQRSVPAVGKGPRALPQRASGPETPLPGAGES